MAKQFYRKAAICATLVGTANLSLAQMSMSDKPKPHTEPRAISVLEKDGKGHQRLVPVTILYQDHYYDAAQYQSNPVPMALVPGNVYEVLKANVPVGWFTTTQAQEVKGNWISAGMWQDKKKESESKPAKVEVSLGKGDDDRPVLKRHGESSSSSSSSSSSKTHSADEDDPDRPTLKKSPSADESASAAPDNTPTPQIAKTTAAPVDGNLTRDTNENDPDRPVLRKTKEGVNPTDTDTKLSIPMGVTQKAAPAKIAAQAGAEQWQQYIAISDTQKTEYRPFGYELKPEEKTADAAKMEKIAAQELQKFALAHGGVKLPAQIQITDYDLRAYDVDYSNNPELIYTASYTVPEYAAGATKKAGVHGAVPEKPAKNPLTYYITAVARIDSNGEANPLFAQVTDSTRLDAYPRLELIDAVDADGMGRGSLLFREYNDVGKAFVLYRVDAYNLTKLFEGASGE